MWSGGSRSATASRCSSATPPTAGSPPWCCCRWRCCRGRRRRAGRSRSCMDGPGGCAGRCRGARLWPTACTRRRGQAALPLLALEWRDIAVLSQRPVALAELSARLRIPLGVGRVLVADMVAEGLLTLLDRDALEGDGADPALLGRVLDGLRSI